MRSFSKLYSDFWVNYDNFEMLGTGIDGQLVALYLQSNAHHNMLGVYYLPLLYISSDLKLSVKKVQIALNKLCKINYCKYDEKTQHVWVCNLAFEQIGRNVGIKDNRIKALQAIWRSLPSKLEFLEEIYNKCHAAFHLELRVFEEHPETCEIKREGAVINANTEINKSIQSAAECLPLVVQPFEVASKLLESLPEDKSADVLKENFFEVPMKVSQTPFEVVSAIPDTAILVKDLSDEIKNVQDATIVTPSIELQSISEDYSKSLPSALHPLSSPFEGPSDPLRSNIEDISKNIEYRNKKKEIEKEKRNINKNTVLFSNIVAQARPVSDEKQDDRVSFFEKTEEAEKARDPEKVFAQGLSNFPIALVGSNPGPKPKLEIIDSKNTANDSVATVFEHWKRAMRHPRAHLDDKRKTLIRKALKWKYSVEQLCDAITGCSITPHNKGDNLQRQRYDGLHIILGSADQIDRFIDNCHSPPKRLTEADQRLHTNLNVAKTWADNKRNESADTMMKNEEEPCLIKTHQNLQY